MLQRLPQRFLVVRQRRPRQGPRRQLADRRLLALQERQQLHHGARIAKLRQPFQGRLRQCQPVGLAFGLCRLRFGGQGQQWGQRGSVAVPGQRPAGTHAHIGMRAGQRLRQGLLRVLAHQRPQCPVPDVLVTVGDSFHQQGLGRLGVLLDQGVHRQLAHVGVLREQRALQGRQLLVLADGERECFLAQLRVGIVEELQEQGPRPRLLFLGHHLGQRLAANVGVDGLEDIAQRLHAAAGNLEVERRLERLAADARCAVVECPGQQFQSQARHGGVLRRLAQEAHQRFQAAPAHVLEAGIEPRPRILQHGIRLQLGQRRERGVANRRLRVIQQGAQAIGSTGIVQGGECPADLGPGRGIGFSAELQEQPERTRIAQDSQAARPTQARIQRPAGDGLQQRRQVVFAEAGDGIHQRSIPCSDFDSV